MMRIINEIIREDVRMTHSMHSRRSSIRYGSPDLMRAALLALPLALAAWSPVLWLAVRFS
jgi:hypothetical protein